MKIISWNLNGLMGTMKRHPFTATDLGGPDIVCLQEIRTSSTPTVLSGYRHIWNPAKRAGYAGTALLSLKAPQNILNGFISGFRDFEGRIISAEYPSFYVVDVYVPTPRIGHTGGLERQAYRRRFDRELFLHIRKLNHNKPVIVCGDFNVARGQLDYYEENVQEYWAMQGYSSDEQTSVENLLELGLVDAFRYLYPDLRSYTWWSSRLNKRNEDKGWRLDYFFISESIIDKLIKVRHLHEIYGSDHCPIQLEVRL